MASGAWCALFLRAPSPGQVFRFLERRYARTLMEQGHLDRMNLLLSDAVGPEAWRVLNAPLASHPWLEERLPVFAAAFAPSVTLLYGDDTAGTWGYRIAGEGGAQAADQAVPLASGMRRLLQRGASGATTAAAAWARERGLPAERIAAVRRLPLVDYSTVTSLDARSLLIENSPRLYSFSFLEGH